MSDLTKQSELKNCTETPMSDHVDRFWRLLETETVRLSVNIRREIGHDAPDGPTVYYDCSTFSDDVAKALIKDRDTRPASTGVREALESIDAILDAVWSTNDRAEEVDGLVKIKAIIRSALSDHGVQIRAGIEPSPAVIESLKSGIERQRDDGFWRSCSGCFETVDGYSSQPVDEIFNCQLGCGCRECGGIGAVWDNTDYDDMVSFMLAEDEADERNERIRKALEFYADPFKSQFTY